MSENTFDKLKSIYDDFKKSEIEFDKQIEKAEEVVRTLREEKMVQLSKQRSFWKELTRKLEPNLSIIMREFFTDISTVDLVSFGKDVLDVVVRIKGGSPGGMHHRLYLNDVTFEDITKGNFKVKGNDLIRLDAGEKFLKEL